MRDVPHIYLLLPLYLSTHMGIRTQHGMYTARGVEQIRARVLNLLASVLPSVKI